MLYVGFPKLVSDLQGHSIECDLDKGLGMVGEEDTMMETSFRNVRHIPYEVWKCIDI